MEQENKWENFGDMNPIEHGGFWIKKDTDDFPNCYHVITVNGIYDADVETWQVCDMYVDLNNVEWAEWDSVNSFVGNKGEQRDEDKVISLVSYYGSVEFGEYMLVEGIENVVAELKEYGIEVESL